LSFELFKILSIETNYVVLFFLISFLLVPGRIIVLKSFKNRKGFDGFEGRVYGRILGGTN
jgi:hypothetical protein